MSYKPLCLVTAPVATRSGYGAHSRDICRALIKLDRYDVKIWNVRWGSTPMNALIKDDARLTALLTDDEEPLSNCCTAPFGYPGWPDNDICSACGEHADASDEEDE